MIGGRWQLAAGREAAPRWRGAHLVVDLHLAAGEAVLALPLGGRRLHAGYHEVSRLRVPLHLDACKKRGNTMRLDTIIGTRFERA